MLALDNASKLCTSVDLTAEQELLFKCARTHLSEDIVQHIRQLCQQPIDWSHLLQMARSHGVMPLLSKNLKESCKELIPTDIYHELHIYLRKNTLDNLRITSDMLAALSLLEKNNIQAIPFKGTVLAATVYGSTGLRKLNDIDILIYERDYDAVKSLLRQAGYRQWVDLPWESHFSNSKKECDIDLHPVVIPKHLACGIKEEYWWSRTTVSTISGSKVTHLSPEAQLMMICFNGTKECWQKLSRVCDLAECLRSTDSFDWDELFENARRQGYERLFLLGLRLAYEISDVPLPQEIAQQLYADDLVERLVEQVYCDIFSNKTSYEDETKRTFFFIRTRDRLLNRISCFLEFMKFYMFFKPDSKKFWLPTSLRFLYYLVVPARLVKYILPQMRYVLFP